MKYYIIILLILISGCSEAEKITKLKIPLLKECVNTVNSAKNFYVKTSATKSYSLDIQIDEFDHVHTLYKGPIGMATLISVGNWQTLDGGTPLNYLRVTANGIFADCAPENMISFGISDNPDMTIKDLSSIVQREGAKYVDVLKNKIVIKYNDGKYKYPF